MSGPLSSNEIEDVVSSVRRLVSVDGRSRPGSRPVSRDLGQDKLILTPALRVVPEEPATEPAETLVLSAQVIEPAAAAPEPALQVVDADWEDPIWQESPTSLAELALGAEEAELISTDEEPASGGMAPVLSDDFEEDEPETVVPLLRTAKAPARPGDAEPGNDAAVPEETASPTAASATMSPEPEEAEASDPEQAEPETGPPGPAALTASIDDVQTLVDKDGNPLTVLDEEALHEIVRTILREELHGVLGERITRNVRKLVRAEINRALTARALD